MRKHLVLITIIAALFASCGNKSTTELSKDDNTVKTIHMSCAKTKILNLSEFADSIEIIALETRDDNLT